MANCNLPKSKTVLSLRKKEIVQLPGFTDLDNYLCKELKEFTRHRVYQYSNKKRGYTVGQYLDKYKENPEPYKPRYQTERKAVKSQQTKEATKKALKKIKSKATIRKMEYERDKRLNI